MQWQAVLRQEVGLGVVPPQPGDGRHLPADERRLHGHCDSADGQCKKTPVDEGQLCLSTDVCQVNASCANGTCAGGQDICACHKDADCATSEDNLCDGKLFCDTNVWPHVCALSPGSVVNCKEEPSACLDRKCDPATGDCKTQAAVGDGGAPVPCDDDDPCTVGDECANGKCNPGKVDTCSCASNADCAKLEDGDACNGTLYCDKASSPPTCKLNPATVVACPTIGDTSCLRNVCYPVSGLCQAAPVEKTKTICADPDKKTDCVAKLLGPGDPVPKPVTCDDGDECTSGEGCKGGTCAGGTDTCGCLETADCAKKEDGDLCNGTLFCNQVTKMCEVNPQTIVFCKSGADTECQKQACVLLSGTCTPTAIGKVIKHCHDLGAGDQCRYAQKPAGAPVGQGFACEDGDPCTKGDVCKGAQCAPGTYTCTCKNNADCVPFDDGDLCNGVQYCDKVSGLCKKNEGSAISCKEVGDSECFKNKCEPKTGICKMTAWAEKEACNDGDPCTKGDVCTSGTCKAGAYVCECWSDLDCAKKEDGNLCNGTLYCDKSGKAPACKLNPATLVACNKATGDPCLKPTCDPKTGKCAPAPGGDGNPCNDGSLCTGSDVCAKGVCVGKAVNCDDSNVCTNDACASAKGCQHEFTSCNDGNDCTQDICDPKTGKCHFDAGSMDGKLCDADASGCTLNDNCKAGLCRTGAQVVCKIPLQPCQKGVCFPAGKQGYTCKPVTLPDGAACEDGVACTVGSSCVAGACTGKGKEKYFEKTLTPPTGEGGFAAVAVHDDGYTLVGEVHDGGDANPNKWRWWVARTDAAGDVTWQKVITGSADHAEQRARAVLPQSGGGAMVAGGMTAADGGLNAMLISFSAEGKQVWQKAFGDKGGDETARDLVSVAGGGVFLAGARTANGQTDMWAANVAATGQQLWSVVSAGKAATRRAASALRLKDGSFLLAGSELADKGGLERALLVPITSDGKAGAPYYLNHSGHAAISDLVALDAGGWLVAGRRCPEGLPCSWLAAVDGKFQTRWEAPTQSAARLAGIGRMTGNRYTVAGLQTPLGGQSGLWLSTLDALGNTQWTRTYAAGAGASAEAVVPTANDGVIVTGTRLAGGKRMGMLLHVNPWGHASCSEGGKCLTKVAGDCDDSQPCTRDDCDSKKGCKQVVTDKLTCEPDDGCSILSQCAGKTCQPGKNGRLFGYEEKSIGAPGKNVYGGMARLSDGTLVMTGQAVIGGKHRAWVRKLSAVGKPICEGSFDLSGTPAYGVGIMDMGKGTFISVGRGHRLVGKKSVEHGALARFDASCQNTSTQKGSYFLKNRPVGSINYRDGSVGTVYERWNDPKYGHRHFFVFRRWPTGAPIWWSSWLSTGSSNNVGYPVLHSPDSMTTGKTFIYGPTAKADKYNQTTIFASVLSSKSKQVQGWVGRLNAGGKEIYRNWFGVKSSAYWLRGGTVLDSQKSIGVGGRFNGGKWYIWLIVLNPGGGLIKEKNLGLGQLFDATALPDNSYYTVGYQHHVGADRPVIKYFSAADQQMWEKRWLDISGSNMTIDSIKGTTDMLVGVGKGWYGSSALFRIDKWGHRGCAEAGTCLSKAKQGCDDQTSCTFDYCMAGSGCKHTKIAGCK